MDTATDILVETARLALAAGFQWWAVIAMLLLLAAVRVLGPKIDLPGDPTQTDARDDANPRKDKPDAQWGTNDGPPGGGMEGG